MIPADSRINPAIGYTIIRWFVVPYISNTPCTIHPTVSAAIPQFHAVSAFISGYTFPHMAIESRGIDPRMRGIMKAYIMK